MSVIKSLQDYFNEYEGIEILTDRTEESESIALFPTGNPSHTEDTIGNKYYTRSYQMLFKKPAFEEKTRQANYTWLEDFCDWMEQQVDDEKYPDLGNSIRITEFSISNLLLWDADPAFKLAVYSVQINITYIKEV